MRAVEQCASEITTTADVDARDRTGRGAQLLHHAQRRQRVERGFGKAEIALVEHRRKHAGRCGLDKADAQAEALQRDRQAGADQATADDQDVVEVVDRAGGEGISGRAGGRV